MQAVKRLYPHAKLAIGPAVDDGFYYDFDLETKFTPEDLAKKIDYWVEHPEEKATEAAEYIEYGKRFELGHCIDQMEKMFEDIINDNVK